MKRENYRKYVSLAIAMLTVLTVFSVMIGTLPSTTAKEIEGSTPTISNNVEISKLNEIVNEFKKGPTITPTLENIIKDTSRDEKIWVYIITEDIKTLGNSLRSMGIDTPIGTSEPSTDLNIPIRAVLLHLTPGEIKKVSSLPGVIKIFNHPKAEIQITPEERNELIDGKIGNVLNPRNFRTRGIYQTFHHNAQDAWMEGFMGSNTTIAIIDTGVDFAQPISMVLGRLMRIHPHHIMDGP